MTAQSYNRCSYCFNNPLRFTDPSGYVVRGRNDVLNPYFLYYDFSSFSSDGSSFNTDIVEGSPSPIYDEDGNFLGTDDEGLQGDAIVMNINDFVQGMSHEDALALSTSLNENNLVMAQLKMNTHYSNLKNRPDWDGYLTKREADEWWKNGNGEALYVDLSMIELNGVTVDDFPESGSFSKNFIWTMSNTGKVYGTLYMNLVNAEKGEVRLGSNNIYSNTHPIDEYDFKMDSRPLRNILTIIGKPSGEGTDFYIFGYKTVKLK